MNMKYFFIFLLFVFSLQVSAQKTGRYRVTFTDKANSKYSINNPQAFLGTKAIERREKINAPITLQDIPVNQWYIDSILACNTRFCNTSKWFNSAVFVCDSATTNFQKIQSFPFVVSVEWVAPYHKAQPDGVLLVPDTLNYDSNYSLISASPTTSIYGNSIKQIGLMNGTGLHKDGYMGQGMLMAIIDAGFLHVDSASVFRHLWENNSIVAYKDFSGAEVNVFKEGYHGMAVLSLIGSYIPNRMIGTAPQAKFLLLRSEEGATEYRVEEDNWTAAAEFADSAGVDVISTSLGYSEFDDSTQNYTYSQIDGNTTRITCAADIAASKGILLFNSAGNSGAKPWKYITAPSDADSVVTVGACYINGRTTGFSSRGPTSLGILKPDVIALGYYPAIVKSNGVVEVSGMGTSFSCPILAGMGACLWQEFPHATAQDIKRAIIASSDRYFYPDTISGNGVPDFEKARFILRMNVLENIFNQAKFYPNPFREVLYFQIESESLQTVRLEMFDLEGHRVISKNIQLQTLITTFEIPEVIKLKPGAYNAVITFGNEHQIFKVIKQE